MQKFKLKKVYPPPKDRGSCGECSWEGKVSDCDWETETETSDGIPGLSYQIFICPKCNDGNIEEFWYSKKELFLWWLWSKIQEWKWYLGGSPPDPKTLI